jgi:hypothetical protein
MKLESSMLVSSQMKRDGRTFDRKTLEKIRLMAVERVREGEPAAKVNKQPRGKPRGCLLEHSGSALTRVGLTRNCSSSCSIK